MTDRAKVFEQLTDCLRKVRDHIEREKCSCTRIYRCERCAARGKLNHARVCMAVLLQKAEPEFSMKIRQEPDWIMCGCGRNLMDPEDKSGCYRCRGEEWIREQANGAMTSCLKCGRPVKGSGKVAHLLCSKCRRRDDPPLKRGIRTHIVDEASVARLRCRVTTLCGRNADHVRVAEGSAAATCQRCLQIRQIRARDQAYRVALQDAGFAVWKLNEESARDLPFWSDAISQIAEELRLRSDGRLQARVIGPEILKRAAQRGERR